MNRKFQKALALATVVFLLGCQNSFKATTGSPPTDTSTLTTGTNSLSCSFAGTSVPSGSSVTAFFGNSVPYGASCQSERRTCSNGTLSGTFVYPSCAVATLCTPGSAQVCTVSNGTGQRTCNSVGSAYSSCQATSCFSGYALTNGSCSAIAPSPTPLTSLSASAAVADGSDKVGTHTLGSDGIGDLHVVLTGVSVPIASLIITGNSGGMWSYPNNGVNWLIAVSPEADPTIVDLYFEYYASYGSYSIDLTFINGLKRTLKVDRSVAAVSLGQDGSDFVGPRTLGADGVKDAHIKLSGVTTPISHVRITPDVGIGAWQSQDDGVTWTASIQPQANPTVVDLFFEPYNGNKSWAYNVDITFTDGVTARVAAAPKLNCSGNLSCFTAALENMYKNFWSGSRATGYVTPTGWIGIVGGSFDGSDSRGSLWPSAEFINPVYSQFVLNPTNANAQPIRAQWNHINSTWSDAELTAVGASAPVNVWADDLGANVEMLLEIYDVTKDDHALQIIKTALNNGYTHFHNNDPRFGGGLWYTDDHTEEASNEVQLALDFFRVYQLTNDQTYLAKGEEMYNWFQSHLLHTDNIYYTDYGWWSSDNKTTDQPHVNWWGSIQEIGSVIDTTSTSSTTVSQCALAGAMGMDVLHARMYRLTGDDQYRQRVFATAQGILKNFVGENGAFFDARDAGVEGIFVRQWILEVYGLLSSDLKKKFKTAFQRTAIAIQANDVTANGSYGPMWAGPADAVSTNLATEVSYKNSWVNATALDFVSAPALVDYVEGR